MKVAASSKNVKISPRKVRLVADAIREQEVSKAIAYLTVLNKRAAGPLKKTIESAIANAVNNLNINKNDLELSEIVVGEGIAYKRYHYAARGRIRPYKKRTSHITVTLSTKSEARNSKQNEKIEEPNVEEKVMETKTEKQKKGLFGKSKGGKE